jgi:hypothetical protein
MTFSKNIGNPASDLTIPENNTGANLAFLAVSTSGISLTAGGMTEIAKYQNFSTPGDAGISFDNIPQTFTHLKMIGQISPGASTTSASSAYMAIRMNNDATESSYFYLTEGNAPNNTATHSHTYFATTGTNALTFQIFHSGVNPSSSNVSFFEITFPNYSQNNQFAFKNFAGMGYNSNSIFRFFARKHGATTNARTPITSIQIGPFTNLRMGGDTDIRLYGIS